MSPTQQALSAGHSLFARYAFPPNELGYCGPAGEALPGLAERAREFDGAWPYLSAIAEAAGAGDPLDADVVRSYWVGGRHLERVDPAALLDRLRTCFSGQVTGLLGELTSASGVLAHHSFHVFVVYPWARFLDHDRATPLQVMQDCRIRWGTVESLDGEHAVVVSRPLTFHAGVLALGEPAAERARWRKDDMSLTGSPSPGETVAAHWDWICGALSETEATALAKATQATLDLVNTARGCA
ncbi:MAG TPA: DUF6390 family protein [Mycobacterium sp.]|nr:DUF6390 family protein [Mycobacterium sp.]